MPSANEPAAAAKSITVAALHRRHFRSNVLLTLILLSVWAVVGLGCGVLLADWLNQFSWLGFPLGFWFAQQGAIVTFVLLILIYALAMGRLDRRLARELLAIAADGDVEDRDAAEDDRAAAR